jgi:AraC family transcriptional activator FtrA
MPTPSGPLVVALVYDGLCTFEFGIAVEVFGIARPEMGQSWYRFACAAIEPGPLRAHGGISITADGGLELIDRADMIVIPGWKGCDVPVPEDLLARLRDACSRGARLVSICSGAFVLAATGLLDGRCVTTHWRHADALRSRFPQVEVDASALYRGEDNLFTSAGSAAGIDLMIELVRCDFGGEAANSVARRIVMPAHRSGGQAQFLERPVRIRPDCAIAPLLDQIRSRLHEHWPIARMANEMAMSRRTLERRFRDATGQNPGDWLVSERIEAAKDLLSSSKSRMEEVAAAVGFASAHVLRHHFRRKVKLTPGQYRRSFPCPVSAPVGSHASRRR